MLYFGLISFGAAQHISLWNQLEDISVYCFGLVSFKAYNHFLEVHFLKKIKIKIYSKHTIGNTIFFPLFVAAQPRLCHNMYRTYMIVSTQQNYFFDHLYVLWLFCVVFDIENVCLFTNCDCMHNGYDY